MPNTYVPSTGESNASLDLIGLARFLLQPLLDEPQSLAIDCEQIESTQKIWVRVAFSGRDKGRVFGRGGRNLQAIRTVLATAAGSIGKSLYFEVYGSLETKSSRNGEFGERTRHRERPHENDRPRRNFGGEDDRTERKPVRRNNSSQ
jgi:predicted RNA-binding protein YlqC (UPF0109 family)